MSSSNLLSITTFIYGAAAFFYIAHLVFETRFTGKTGHMDRFIGCCRKHCGIIMRWVESYRLGIGHAASNMYESLVFFSGTIIIIYLVVERQYKNRIIGAFTMPLAFLAMAYASLLTERVGSHSAPGSRPEKQLADRPRHELFHRVLGFCRGVRTQCHVPAEATGSRRQTRLFARAFSPNPAFWTN